MDSAKIKWLSGQLKAIVEANKDFPQKLEKRLVSGSRKVENQSKFIAELFNEGVLCDGSNDVEMLAHLAVTIGCSKGADGIGGMLRALESSGNSQLVSALQTWAKRDFQIKTDDDGSRSEPQGSSAVQPRKKRRENATSPTELSLGNQPRSTASGLFAATSEGLIAVDLRTLEATALTSGKTLAVALNHKLKKVYWSEGYPNSHIMRSNIDGSNKEVIVPHTGDCIEALAIDESSGNVYYALFHSHEIRVCDALGKNCTPVIRNSTLVTSPRSIAVDSVQGFMYWGNRVSGPNSLVRANLDGSNAIIISTGFRSLDAVTLEQHSNDVLYWADGEGGTIGTIEVNGGNKRTLLEVEGDEEPWGIQVDAQKIYFINCYSGNILSVDKGSGKELTMILSPTDGGAFNLALLLNF